MADIIEFYEGVSKHPFAHVYSSHRMNVGEYISIGKVTYKVIGISFAFDHSADGSEFHKMRCNIILKIKRPPHEK